MAATSGDSHRFGAERLRETQGVGDTVTLRIVELGRAAGFDVERGPWRVQPVGHQPGVADKTESAGVLVDTDKETIARRPRARDRLRLHSAQELIIDPLGGAAQRKLAQGGQIVVGEEMFQRPLGLLRDVDLALL